MPRTSRLQHSTNAPLRTMASITQFCDKHRIPYSNDFLKIIAPASIESDFVPNYSLDPLPPTGLKNHGTSSILVFESKHEKNHHGEVVSAIAHQVGNSLEPHVDTLYVHRSLNPSYRTAFQKDSVNSIKRLVENQGTPVLHTSIGWDDKLLDFDKGHEDQANHLWRVTAFVVDSAGNDGKNGGGNVRLIPYQKHNALTHFAPLVVHVGAAAMDAEGIWNIEGYSSANSPTFLAPVATRTHVIWSEAKGPKPVTGTSAAAPYVSGLLAALNHRYGAYLTREQILYAVMATSTPITHVNAYPPQTKQEEKIVYKPNAAGLLYNPEYAGFGLVFPQKADRLLANMVALTAQHPESITVPTEERVTLLQADENCNKDANGVYHYSLQMPPGFALKTTIEADFTQYHGSINITSPSGTTLPMVMSGLDSTTDHFGMSTSHGWAGERLEGTWTITSTNPIKRLRLSQHHFLEKDIIHGLDIQKLSDLNSPPPDLSQAVPLQKLPGDHPPRILREQILPPSAEPHGLQIGANGAVYVPGDFNSILTQLKSLPSGFAVRNRKEFLTSLPLDPTTPAGQLEAQAIDLVSKLISSTTPDTLRHQIAEKQLAAADEYKKAGEKLNQITPLLNAGHTYFACQTQNADGELNAEKAIRVYTRALKICRNAELYHKAYEIGHDIYTALCRCCEQGKSDQYSKMLEGIRHQTFEFSRKQQGMIDRSAHRIEEGEYGFSNLEKIGTDNVSQCIALVVQDPRTLKTGIAHIDNHNDIGSLDTFFSHFGQDRLNIRLVGARFNRDFRTNENISAVMEYLSHKNADIISSDIYDGNNGPSTVVVDPITFSLEEKVPGRSNRNEAASNAVMLMTRKGKPLIEQFDFTTSTARTHARKPIHLNRRMLAELREKYFNRQEWEIEGHLNTQQAYDRPLLVTHMLGLEQAYTVEWNKLSTALEINLKLHGITGQPALQAHDALLRQSIYVGENAETANKPLFDWINNQLIRDGVLQRTALDGPTATLNIYDPPGPLAADGFTGQTLTRASQSWRAEL